MSTRHCTESLLASMVVVFLGSSGAAVAQTTARSLAFGESVDVSVASVTIDSGPLPSASGDAPPAYAVGPNSSAGVSVDTILTGSILETGLLQASASSPVPGSDSATAEATVDDPELSIVGGLLLPLLTIDADTLEATAAVGGTCGGSLTANGGASFENADVGGTLGGSLQIPVDPPANTVLLDQLGIRVVLNEQVVTGDGVDDRRIEVNALHVQLTAVSLLGIGLLSGHIYLGHAEAEIDCDDSPEPTPTPGPTPSGGPTSGPTPTADPTPTGGGGPTPTPGPTSGPTQTPKPTGTPEPTPTPLPGEDGTDPYTNELGLSTDRFAGATLNPGGVGQLLYGVLYDVRPAEGLAGASDAQHVNLQIVNTNPTGSANGGVLARVRFRESKTSREVLAFDVALSCAEVWAGSVSLQGQSGAAVPAIRSAMPVVSAIDSETVTTAPELNPNAGGEPRPFDVPSSLTAADVRRGYFEVIAEEQLPCEPVEGVFSRDGNTYERLSGAAATPPNSLSGHAFLVRATAGVAFGYDMPAVSRFVIAGGGSIQAPVESGLPDVSSCVGYDASNGQEYTGLQPCLSQLDLALSKGRLHAQYDVDPLTAARSYLVVTLPTKGMHCVPGDASISPPFRCDPSGERVGCRLYDRDENELSPSPECNLPRELSTIRIGGTDANSDESIDVGEFKSGWVLLDLVSDPFPGDPGVHERVDLDPDRVDFLGVGQRGFRGLPVLSLVLQEYFNGNVGGSFGESGHPSYELELLPD